MTNYQIKVTYVSGMEVIDIRATCATEAIMEAMKLVRIKNRQTGVYNSVKAIEILQNTF